MKGRFSSASGSLGAATEIELLASLASKGIDSVSAGTSQTK
jgi:hypothetical protein